MNVSAYNMPESGPAAEVAVRLTSLKRRARALAVVAGLGWIAVAGLITSTAFIFAIGWWGGVGLRTAGWVCVSAVVALVALFRVALPLRSVSSEDAVARRVGAVFPDLASDILSASQFVTGDSVEAFSPDLLDRHLRESSRKLEMVSGREVFPGRTVLVPAVAMALVVGGLLLVDKLVPGVIGIGFESVFSEPHVSSFAIEETVTRSPVVGDLTITLRYPDYLDRPHRKLSDSSGGIVAPLGTTATLEGRALVDGATRGGLRLPGNRTAPVTVRPNGWVSGRFVIEEAGTFSLTLSDDKRMIEGPGRVVEVEEDLAPTVRLLRPVGDVVVDEGGDVVLEFEAIDDHGIGRIDLVLETAGGPSMRRTILRTADEVERLKSRYRWIPSEVKLGEEATVNVALEVFDNDLMSGPKPGRSRNLVARVMTRLSRHRSVLEQQQQSLDALIDLLAARLGSPVPGGKRKEEAARERFTLLRSRTEDVLGKTARLIHEMGQDPLTPNIVEEAFLQIREDLSAQLIHEARLHRDPMEGFKTRQGVDRVTVRLIEAAVIRVDDLILDQQFNRLVGDGDRLMDGRAHILELTKGYARTRGEKARRDLVEAIKNMENVVSALTRDLEGVRGKVGDVYFNPSSVQVIDLAGTLERLRALLAADDIEGALALAARLEEMVSRLMTGLESGHLSFRTERFGEGEKFLGELLDRLMTIESEQLQLRRQTTALRRRYNERLLEVMEGKIDPLVKKQVARTSSLRRLLEGAQVPADLETRQRFVAVKVGLRELGLALGQGDLDEALLVASDLEGELDLLVEDVARDELKGDVIEARGTIAEISREIKEAFPRPSLIFSDRDRRDLRGQTARQRHLSAKTRKLRTWIKKQGDETRFLAHQALGSLNLVASKMGDGVSHLETHRIREALEVQTEALDELERLRQDLRRGDEARGLESRPVVLAGDVDIPEPGEYEVPAEYREDILEAMRGDLPANYREAIERYYETLVR